MRMSISALLNGNSIGDTSPLTTTAAGHCTITQEEEFDTHGCVDRLRCWALGREYPLAEAAFDAFIESYQVKYDKAAECLKKDREALLAFYDFPAEQWKHLRTTNPSRARLPPCATAPSAWC